MKKIFSTRRNRVTKKFWKFVDGNGCSPGSFGVIKYITGETVEVKDANPNENIQCASGIHCLDFSDEQYDEHNMVFGPKAAILEVDEEDIIYYGKGGKCRVKKAKVLEVKEPELWMRTGNDNSKWAFDYALVVVEGHDPDLMEVIIKNKIVPHAYNYAFYILGEHNEKLMNIIIDARNAHYAYYYALNVLKGHDEKLMEVVNKDHFYKKRYAFYILNCI